MKGKANVPGASGLDMARIQKVASDAASVAAEAKKTAESASTAAGTAQKAADKALEAISKLAFTLMLFRPRAESCLIQGAHSPLHGTATTRTRSLWAALPPARMPGPMRPHSLPRKTTLGAMEAKTPRRCSGRSSVRAIAITPTQSGSLTYTGRAQSRLGTAMTPARCPLAEKHPPPTPESIPLRSPRGKTTGGATETPAPNLWCGGSAVPPLMPFLRKTEV